MYRVFQPAFSAYIVIIFVYTLSLLNDIWRLIGKTLSTSILFPINSFKDLWFL